MKTLLILLCLTSTCFAGQRVFYDPVMNVEIVDLSSSKSILEIEGEFGLVNVKKLDLQDNEGYRVKNKKLVKYNYVDDNIQQKQNRKNKTDQQAAKMKQKLGLTDAEWQDLKEAIREE